MTTKQFFWLKSHQPFSVRYFDVYECKKPKNYHHLSKIEVELNGGYFLFKGVYHTFNGRFFEEHSGRYKIHYKNIRKLYYEL